MRNLFDNPLLLVVLLLVIVVVFGARRLPDAARSVGRSMRIFKSEVKELRDDDGPASQASAAPLNGRVIGEEPASAAPEVRGEELRHVDDVHGRR